MKKNITMKDIADRMGISTVTVSKALADKEGVGEELKQRIKDMALEVGYRINAQARAMKDGQSLAVCILVSERFLDQQNSFYMQFYKHLSNHLEESRYLGMLSIVSLQDERQDVLPLAWQENRVDAFIVLGQLRNAYLDALIRTGLPLVFLDFYDDHTDVDAVVTDNFHGAYLVTNHLIRQGHHKLAFVGNVHATSSIQDRYLGFCRSLLEHRIPMEQCPVVNDRDEEGHLTPLVLPETLPTAFVCNCDKVARELVQTLRKQDVRVPEDVSVTGFDNDMYASMFPTLTTLEINAGEMAKQAVRMVIGKIRDGNRVYGRVTIPGRLILRESTKPPALSR